MESFDIIRPSPALAPYVRHYWFLKISGAGIVEERTIPVGCMSLIFHRGDLGRSSALGGRQPRTFISGMSTAYDNLSFEGVVDMAVVVFQPFGAGAFFDIPVNEFRGLSVSVADTGDKTLPELEDKLFSLPDVEACTAAIEECLLSKLRVRKDYNLLRVQAAVQAINANNIVSVAKLADTACLGVRQFNRIFSENVGTTPKEFSRIVRFQRALFLLQTNQSLSLAQLAHDSGYFDQPHMIREFKEFSGYTPVEYLKACAPYSDYFSHI